MYKTGFFLMYWALACRRTAGNLCTSARDEASSLWKLQFYFYGSTALLCQSLLIVEVPRSHSDAPQSVGFLWTSDRPVAQTST